MATQAAHHQPDAGGQAPANSRRARRPTNISLSRALVAEARALGLNLSAVCEAGLAQAVRREQARRFAEENRAAFDAANAWFEEHGHPLADLQQL